MSNNAKIFEDLTSLGNSYCICCLEHTGSLIKIEECIHSGFLQTFPMPNFDPPIPKVVCQKCHSMLKRINNFKSQVQESYRILYERVSILNKLDTNSNLTISKIEHVDISENEYTTKDVHIKKPHTYTTNKILKNRNIETAFNIINTNAKSLQSIVSNNFKSLTDTLWVVANDHLNLEPNNIVLPETSTSSSMLPNEKYLTVKSSKRKLVINEKNDLLQKTQLNKSAKTNEEINTAPVVSKIGNTDEIKLLDIKKNTTTKDTNVKKEDIKNNKLEILPIENNCDIDTDINNLDVSKEFKTEIDLCNDIELSMDIKKEKEEDVVFDSVCSTNVLPADLNMESDDSETDSEKALKEIETGDHVNMNETLPIISRTLTLKELQEERENKLKSIQYLKWPHRCDSCIVGFNFKENLDDHNRRKHEMRSGQKCCDICKQIINADNIDEHTAKHYERLQCKECKILFALNDEAYQHFKTVHGNGKLKRKLTKNNGGIKKRR